MVKPTFIHVKEERYSKAAAPNGVHVYMWVRVGDGKISEIAISGRLCEILAYFIHQ
jgi:hypothetical protein